jgi:hypothetical protein
MSAATAVVGVLPHDVVALALAVRADLLALPLDAVLLLVVALAVVRDRADCFWHG